jgi:hypothetical protein
VLLLLLLLLFLEYCCFITVTLVFDVIVDVGIELVATHLSPGEPALIGSFRQLPRLGTCELIDNLELDPHLLELPGQWLADVIVRFL